MPVLSLDKVMAKEKMRGEELSAIGKQTMARAYSAMDYYFDHLKKTVASAPTGGTEFGEKVKACAEQNISATQEFVRELSYAKDIQDMLRIQMQFMRSQLDAFGEQAKDLSEAYIKEVSGQTTRPSLPDA
jgi:hypothetical protein